METTLHFLYTTSGDYTTLTLHCHWYQHTAAFIHCLSALRQDSSKNTTPCFHKSPFSTVHGSPLFKLFFFLSPTTLFHTVCNSPQNIPTQRARPFCNSREVTHFPSSEQYTVSHNYRSSQIISTYARSFSYCLASSK